MGRLTETAYHTRKAINWAILAVIGYFILRLFWGLFVTLWLIIFPPQAIPPNHAFGKLPALKFPATATPSGQLTFRLESIEGTVPEASDAAIVYFMPKNASNLLGLSKAQDFAGRIGFVNPPIQETKYLYRFDMPDNPLKYMRYDIVSKNFVIRYLFERDTTIFTEREVPLETLAKDESKGFLTDQDIFPEDVKNGTTKTTYLRFVGDKLVTTTSLSQADAIRIDFFRAPIGETPVVTPNPDEGPITFIYSGSASTQKHVLQIAYTYWTVDYGTTGTYGLKSSSQAWQELQSGMGYIARYPKGKSMIATVRRAYLAYYDSLDPQTYLQPIFVFEGDDGFLGYVPAVASPWTD